MDYLKVKTSGNSNPQGKPRVYFTCHPKDSENNFEKICEDIFKTQDCAIYYTEDMTAEIPEEYRETDLNQMNLFVVPITFRLLTETNRAMDFDIRFALEKHIPILPIMVESGIDEFYEQKFGKLQYLNPYSHDLTEISYEEKLKKYLSSILFDDETAEKVRAAFDAYIFLSYRKKDRKYANELMHLIHSNPICRDIAIWYDEFLTPGESFSDSIEKMLEKSDLFALLVTPNLVNEENYVKSVEYPAAKKADKKILPAEMVSTDVEELKRQYEGIPDSVNANDDTALKESLVKAFSSYALRENDNDPMHNYLIGLAYLEGIDVEINREKAVELITSAAEAELPEAMMKLVSMYHDGYCVGLDWHKSHFWTEKLADYYIHKNGEKDEIALVWLGMSAFFYGEFGEYKKALEIQEKVYALQCEILGEKHLDSLLTLNNLAETYGRLNDHKKRKELLKKIHPIYCEILGKNHPDTLLILSNLASAYGKLDNNKMALKLNEEVYAIRCEILGEKHLDTLTSLNNLAVTYCRLGEYGKGVIIFESVYSLSLDVLGPKHPNTIRSLSNYAYACENIENYEKALELQKKAYDLYYEMFGEKHPDTLEILFNLAIIYGKCGNFKKELELKNKVHALYCETLGEKYTDTIDSLKKASYNCKNIGNSAESEGNVAKAKEYYEKDLKICKELVEIVGTFETFRNLCISYNNLGNIAKVGGDTKSAKEYYEKDLEISKKLAKSVGTPELLRDLSLSYNKLGDIAKLDDDIVQAKEYYEKSLEIRIKLTESLDTPQSFRDLSCSYERLGDIAIVGGDIVQAKEYYEKSLEIRIKLVECVGIVESYDDLAISYCKLASIYNDKALYEKAYEIWESLCCQFPQANIYSRRRDKVRSILDEF